MKPLTFIFRVALFGVIPVLIQACNSSEAQLAGKNQQDQYQCLPCGSDCDSKTYTAAGECSGCHMQLVKKSSVKHHSISPAEICDYIKKHPEAILLDVRTKREFEGKDRPNYGTLKNAINIPVQQLESKLASISHLKDKEILVYCSHSQRSPRASYMLTQHGFTNVTNMNGGMSEVTATDCVKK